MAPNALTAFSISVPKFKALLGVIDALTGEFMPKSMKT
jgi:hypothetical protein